MIYMTAHTLKPRAYGEVSPTKSEPNRIIINKDQINIVKKKNYCPLYHRVNEDPKLIGTFKRNNKYDWCHIGKIYDSDILPSSKYKNYIIQGKVIGEYLTYEERRKVYLSSIFHIATQGWQNILDGHVSQRIYEGLAYGCIVITNSKEAAEQTNNIVEYVSNLQDVENKIEYFKNNPDKIIEKQKLGYEFIKKEGTNIFSISKLNNKTKELFNIDFLCEENIETDKLSGFYWKYPNNPKIYWSNTSNEFKEDILFTSEEHFFS